MPQLRCDKQSVCSIFLPELFASTAFAMQYGPKIKLMPKCLGLKLSNDASRSLCSCSIKGVTNGACQYRTQAKSMDKMASTASYINFYPKWSK